MSARTVIGVTSRRWAACATVRCPGVIGACHKPLREHYAGDVVLFREDDPVVRFAGALTGVYLPGELDTLRDEWD